MIEELRQEHVRKYGSFLHCPERKVLCSFMEEALCKTGVCERQQCILDDPEYQKLKERIRKKFEENEKKRQQLKEEDEPPIRIRSPRKNPDMYIWAKINRLEEESREAYRRNRPKVGEAKLHEAIVLRRKLRRKDV